MESAAAWTVSPTSPTTRLEPASVLFKVLAACNASRADLASEPSASVWARTRIVSINYLAAKKHKSRKIKLLLIKHNFGVYARPRPGPLPQGEGEQRPGAGYFPRSSLLSPILC